MPAPKTQKKYSKGKHLHKTVKKQTKFKSMKCSPKNKKDVLALYMLYNIRIRQA